MKPDPNCPYCDGSGTTGGIDNRTCHCLKNRSANPEPETRVILRLRSGMVTVGCLTARNKTRRPGWRDCVLKRNLDPADVTGWFPVPLKWNQPEPL